MSASYRVLYRDHQMFPSFSHIEKTYKVIAQVDVRPYIRFPF